MSATTSSIKFVFFGTPDIAVTALDILERHALVPTLIVTRADAEAGRGKILTPSPVKRWAIERGIDVLTPQKIDADFISEIANTEWDVFVLVAYGMILPQALIDLPRRGIVNMHPSLLPRLRGPSPIQSAVLTDERVTGVSVMLIDDKMDHGPVIAQAKVEIPEDEWPMRESDLAGILAEEGATLLAETLPPWVAGTIEAIPQDESLATFTKKVRKEDGLISLSDDPHATLLKIRAFEGWPGTYAFFERNGARIRTAILEAHLDSAGALCIDTVKPEGKNEMPYADFLRGGATPVDNG
jgi:methionyl-tRNA formyltransferase